MRARLMSPISVCLENDAVERSKITFGVDGGTNPELVDVPEICKSMNIRYVTCRMIWADTLDQVSRTKSCHESIGSRIRWLAVVDCPRSSHVPSWPGRRQ